MKRGNMSWQRSRELAGRGAICVSLGLAALVGSIGCNDSDPVTFAYEKPESVPLSKRAGTVVVEGCRLTSGQDATLASASIRANVQTVILMCLSAQTTGQIRPQSVEGRFWIQSTVETLKLLGYRVHLGLGMMDETGTPYAPASAAALLKNETWRSSILTELSAVLGAADGIEIAPPQLDDEARVGMTAFVQAVATTFRPSRQVGVFLPPSVTQPSDLPGGEAFDVASLASFIDRGRLMTLDFSCCGSPPGPTIDSGWSVDAFRLARTLAPALALDLSVPLYGVDFSEGKELPVSFLEAQALAAYYHAHVMRGPTYAPHFAYADPAGHLHELWFDDTASTLVTMSAWEPPTVPLDVGILFYGLGAEDPGLWETLGRSAR